MCVWGGGGGGEWVAQVLQIQKERVYNNRLLLIQSAGQAVCRVAESVQRVLSLTRKGKYSARRAVVQFSPKGGKGVEHPPFLAAQDSSIS